MPALRYLLTQLLVGLPLIVIGWFVLIIPCIRRSYHAAPATQNRLGAILINQWDNPLLWIWGNDEDGVTGKPGYNPTLSRWGTYKWAALRNPADNFKYVRWTQRQGGPLLYKTFFGGKFYIMAGWNGSGYMVGSVGHV